jgi:SAM-dependent methyltransferase
MAESTLEVVAELARALTEAFRVLAPAGRLWLTTPNRWSLGPDPHAGLWAGGWLPPRAVAWWVRRAGGIPPRRRLLSTGTLREGLRAAGFTDVRLFLPPVPDAQRRHLPPLVRAGIAAYGALRRSGPGRWLLLRLGPLIGAVTTRP